MPKDIKTCPSPQTLNRIHIEGDYEEIAEHLEQCETCRALLDELDGLSLLAEQLPPVRVREDARAITRRALLASAVALDSERRPRFGWAVPAAAAAAALLIGSLVAALVWTSWGADPSTAARVVEPIYRATVVAHDGARYVRLGQQPDEVVRLFSGTVTVEVTPLQQGERFRVVTGNGTIEVRGTAFDATADADNLTAVRVIRGRVEVSTADREVVVLNVNDVWRPAAADAGKPTAVEGPPRSTAAVTEGSARSADESPPMEPRVADAKTAEVVRARPRRDSLARTSPPPEVDPPVAEAAVSEGVSPASDANTRAPDAAELAFQEGLTAYRGGNLRQAAATLGRVPPGTSVSEDAAYWRGVALVRSGQKREGMQHLWRFRARYPNSMRRHEVAVMLGWMSLRSNDRASAKRLFEDASHSPSRPTRTSALRGLEAIDQSEAEPR